jgi:hypothetical protein
MTAEQATQQLAVMQAAYDAKSAPQLPSAEQIESAESAYDAEVRLARLTADESWMRRYAAGSRAERAEYEQLTRMIAAGADETGMSVRVGDVETLREGEIRRADLFGVLSDMNKAGVALEGLERFLDGNFSDEDIEFAQRELDRLTATPAWRDALLAGDPQCRHELVAWSAVISSGKAA